MVNSARIIVGKCHSKLTCSFGENHNWNSASTLPFSLCLFLVCKLKSRHLGRALFLYSTRNSHKIILLCLDIGNLGQLTSKSLWNNKFQTNLGGGNLARNRSSSFFLPGNVFVRFVAISIQSSLCCDSEKSTNHHQAGYSHSDIFTWKCFLFIAKNIIDLFSKALFTNTIFERAVWLFSIEIAGSLQATWKCSLDIFYL